MSSREAELAVEMLITMSKEQREAADTTGYVTVNMSKSLAEPHRVYLTDEINNEVKERLSQC